MNPSDILTKNVPEKLLTEHATRIRDGNLQCRENWDELVANIEEPDDSIHHVQWEDIRLWIAEGHADDNRRSETAYTVRDGYIAARDSFDVESWELVYVH
jgi:hypothetical protein